MTQKMIRKRDGRLVEFHTEKIRNAIWRSFLGVGQTGMEDVSDALARKVETMLELEGCEPEVEHVQDLVEQVLMQEGYGRTAKAYILYREERSRARQVNSSLMRKFEEITFKDAADSDIKRENANIDGDTAMGTMLRYGSEAAKQFSESFLMKPEYATAHERGDIHIHDLDFYALTTTCCQIDLLSLFHGGFSTGLGHIREPQSIASYASLACIAIQSNQNDQHGGQSIVNFDYAMAEGVAKTYRACYRQNLSRALELLCDVTPTDAQLRGFAASLAEKGLTPALAGQKAYDDAEAAQLKAAFGCVEGDIRRAQEFAARRAAEETDRATYQAMESLIHNLNTMESRSGSQTPFSSINYGMDTSPEGRLVMKNLLLATEAGLGSGETPIFPIQIFRVKSGVNLNEGEPNYDLFRLACRCSAKRLFPNFSFQDAPFNLKYYKEGHPETEIAYMGCRTRVVANAYDPSREVTARRGNLSFTSINLPRLAILARGDREAFFRSLDEMLDLVVGQLLERLEIQSRRRVRNFPFLMGQGVWLDSEKLGPDDEVREVLKHGTLSIGFIGLAECLKALTGAHHGESAEAQALGLEIIGRIRDRADRESAARGLNFSCLATPAEGLSGRFVRMDAKRFGVIPGVTDREYYTNSFHVPVYYPISAFNKLRIEAPYHALTNGGHISYIEMDGDPLQNLPAFEKVVRFMGQCGIGYGSINHPVDRDPVCGFNGIIGDTCPRCGRRETPDQPFERIRRITGYLVGTLDRFNNGKRAEERDRVKHGVTD